MASWEEWVVIWTTRVGTFDRNIDRRPTNQQAHPLVSERAIFVLSTSRGGRPPPQADTASDNETDEYQGYSEWLFRLWCG
jgi:hypothetical protein